MDARGEEEFKGQNKINYKEKNLEFIEKLKEKKQREIEEKLFQQKREQIRRESLRKKILDEASKNRESKLRELTDIDNHQDLTVRKKNSAANTGSSKEIELNFRTREAAEHQASTDRQKESSQKTIVNYQEKYISFLSNLKQSQKSKKQIEQSKKKQEERKYNRIKEQLGFANVEGKLTGMLEKKTPSELIRSQSAEKFKFPISKNEPLSNSVEDGDEANQNTIDMPRTTKNFKQKNEEYIEKIKRRRQLAEDKKNEDQQKKQRLKSNLKDFVINTVKKNVLEGVYDNEIVDKFEKKKSKNTKKPSKNEQEGEDLDENCGSSSESQEESERVKKPKRKLRSFPHCASFEQWKKKNRLENGEKIFIVTGGYGELKKALRERGWLQNPSSSSPFFDLKFSLQGRQIDYGHLQDYQIVNHFQKNGVITTKIGLTKALRNLIWINDTSEDNFYPKCFDLNDEDDKIGFENHFKICKALSILKIYVDSAKTRKVATEQKGLIEDLKLRTEVAVSVCYKNIEDINDVIDKKKTIKVITDKEWEILSQDELNEESLAKKKHQEWLKSIDCKYNGLSSASTKGDSAVKAGKKSKKKRESKLADEKQEKKNQGAESDQEEDEQEEDETLQRAKQLLSQYEQKYPQYHLTDHNNIWILKPAGLSRGRGITTYNNLIEIQDHMKTKQSQWIAQKYIENPLIIERRKFDIRQWVMVTDFNPLTIWFYDESYIRFSAIDYDPKQINNKFIHLCNNSIGSYAKEYKKSHIKGNMYFEEECRNYLLEKEGYDVYEEKIKPQIKEIVKNSLMCAVYDISSRKNSHELYGYDFMVDTNYKVWLLEINSSPSMEYSTHVTTKLVKQVLPDIVKVIVDRPSAPVKERKHVDTGKFKKIYKGIEIPDKGVNTAGLNLCLEGMALKKSKKRATVAKVQNMSLDNKK